MKHKFLLTIATAGFLCGVGTGCINTPNPLPSDGPVPLKQKQTAGVELQMKWIKLLGKNVDKTQEITTRDTVAPFRMDIPDGFSAVGSGLNSMICVSPMEASVRMLRRNNLPGGTLDFWRKVISRVLIEDHGYEILADNGLETTERVNSWTVTGKRIVEGAEYKYKLVMASFDDELYMVELFGSTAAFDSSEKAFDRAVDSMDLGFWRMRHERDCTNPFLAFDPVKVTPPEGTGLFKTSWTPLQLGLFPYVQLWDSPSHVYGIGLDLFFLDQKRVGGISFSLFNAVKESYGIQLAPIAAASEENCGLSIGLLYNIIHKNNGLSIGLINRAEEGSHGVQIGLLNFNSSPDYLYCFPIINFPIFACFR